MRKQIVRFTLLLLICSLFSGISILKAQEEGEGIVIGTYHKLHSKILGEERTLLVHLPEGYDQTEANYPVLYLLYGDHVTTYFAETVAILDRLGRTGRIPSMVLVSVMNTDRYRDLLPVRSDGTPSGIGNFQTFFSDELFPWVDRNYRTKDYRILAGPQAGANFGLFTMIDKPEMFNAMIINHPFRWEGGRDMLWDKIQTFFANNQTFKKFLFITYRVDDELEKEGLKYLTDFKDLVDQKQINDFRLELNYLENNDEFIQPMGLREGIKELFTNYPFPEDLQTDRLEDISSYYRKLSYEYGFEIDIPEHVLTNQSDKLSERGKTDEALRIWEYMRDNYPRPGNAYWRLGNYHRQKGNKELAIEYYKKLIELYPDVAMARRLVEELEKEVEK